ncbi:ABC transporter permease [Halosolutus amylolyticus]|uniref:ABC transporter permease n=1 Tax=Halosolutus amylolyticus TaxID=2932267 RepID=A0ABD5PJ41_9EURY|nr:ABC transporter permease [Halosolutus amylolyticus]
MSTETAGGSRATTTPSSSIDPDSIRAIAKKDFQDAVRSWLFMGLSMFFFMILVIPTAILWYTGADLAQAGATTEGLISLTHSVTRLVIPLIALVLGWKAIAGERESGSIKVLLSLPHSRKDVLLGKLIGRAGVLSVSLVTGFLLAAAIVAVLFGGFDVVDYVGLLLVSILYGVAYTSIAVAISSFARSTTVAGAFAFGVFVLFYIVWETVLGVANLLVRLDYLPGTEYTTTGLGGETVELTRPHDVFFLFNSFDPGVAYRNVLTLATSVAERNPDAIRSVEEAFGGNVPFYMQDWFSLVVLLFWIVVPIAVALYRFDKVDL